MDSGKRPKEQTQKIPSRVRAREGGYYAVNYKSLPLFTVKYQNKEQVSRLSIPNAANSNRCKRKVE